MTQARLLVAVFLVLCATPAHAQTDPPPTAEQPAEPKLVLREVLVLQADRYDDTANNPKLLASALPAAISKSGRDKSTTPQEQYAHKPMPLGILTFQGTISEPIKLRIKLRSSNGRFQAHWPKDALVGGPMVQWDEVREADDQQRAEAFGDQGGWLADLRSSEDRLWLRSRDKLRKERFILYDASFKFTPNIELGFADGVYRLKTRAPEQAAPPLCVLVRRNDGGWTADALAAPWTGTTPPIAGQVSQNAATPSLKQALLPIKELLEKRGYNPQEIELALGMIASAGFDTSKLSLVYVLPVGVIEDHVLLQIKPKPDKIIRTAIVVVNNVDPNLSSQVNALLDDLGSDQWLKRDRAQRELIALGQAAIKKVRQLKDDKDPEVAFRARQILDAYDWKMNGGR